MGKPGAKMYCVVRFPKSNLTECTVEGETDSKMVAIPLSTQRCEKGCCAIETLPLRVCYALTTHKVQGMALDLVKYLKRVSSTLLMAECKMFLVSC